VGRAALEHYQLRHNIGYARNHNIIYNSILDSGLGLINGERWENERCGIRSFNILTNESHVLLDLHKEQKSHIKLCSLSTLDDLISAGGVRGELLIKRMYSMEDKTHYLSLTDKENGITNFLKLYEASSGSLNVVSCNNDGFLRIINIDTKKIISGFSFDWAPNCVSPNPEKKLALVVGDNVESQIISLDTGKVLYSIAGHVDHNFACDWAPDDLLFATGSQDLTCRIYDSRFINSALYVFPASMTAFRSLHFSPASNLLLMAESADFLHLIDLGQPLLSQEIDFFGEVTGTCWNFKGNCFYAGNADLNIGGIFEYQLNADQDFIL
jgi:WD40 repeat protein